MMNTTICVLQKGDKQDLWEPRDIIFTDCALYIFAQVQNPREQVLNYLTAPFERLNMRHFVAKKPYDENEDDIEEPKYMKFLPR